jgi:Protein of unknown function (DUF2442)
VFLAVFLAVEDPAIFKKVQLDSEAGTIVWPNGLDFCPDVLYSAQRPARGRALK